MLRDQIRSFDRAYLERPGHLPGVEVAALPHHVFEKRDLALVDEEHQLAGLGEVDLGGEQAQARQPLVAVARHGRGCNCEQRSAEAIADCVHLGAPVIAVAALIAGSTPSVR